MVMKNMILAAGMTVSLAILLSCSSSEQSAVSGTGGATAQCDLNNPPATVEVSNTSSATTTTGKQVAAPGTQLHALHNVHSFGSKMISGAVPEGDAAFDELVSMGVKTILSVDGATPDVKRAEARGMRYVHIPITYAEATREQQLEIARAVRDLPGPVYIHCHHGKHRSPAAAASAAVLLGESTPEQAVAFMKRAGTASSYSGLYECVASAVAADAAALDAAPHSFPAVRLPKGITAAMVDIDTAYENLGAIRESGWKTPVDHPDLVPAEEAGRLGDLLRISGEDDKAKVLGSDFGKRLADAVLKATSLEDGIAAKASPEVLESRWQLVVGTCKDCHAKYRDGRKW